MNGTEIMDFLIHLFTAEFPAWQVILAMMVVSTIVRKI